MKFIKDIIIKNVKDENVNELILNLNNKSKYVLHILNLKYYLEQGLIFKKKVHSCIKFNQSNWLEPYIPFNNNKRKQATNDFEKDLFKLMKSSVFGKTMENVRNHQGFELVNNIKRYEECVMNSSTFKHKHIINENLVGVEKMKSVVKLNKPMYVGMTILDLSKLHMYKFYYDTLKPKYEDDIKMAYTDTDSFVTHVKTDDIYDDFNQLNNHMDFSDYNKEHKCYDNSNKKVLGKFKDEVNGK